MHLFVSSMPRLGSAVRVGQPYCSCGSLFHSNLARPFICWITGTVMLVTHSLLVRPTLASVTAATAEMGSVVRRDG